MKRLASLFLIVFFSIFCIAHFLQADTEQVFLKKIMISGNKVTKTKYIESFITFTSGKQYQVDSLIQEINKSRENLKSTGLFTNIFFDDQRGANNQLTITIRVTEKNYLYIEPAGYAYLSSPVSFDSALSVRYLNLFGNNSLFYLTAPFYENRGVTLFLQNDVQNRFRYTGKIAYLLYSTQKSYTTISSSLAVKSFSRSYFGLKLKTHWYDYFSFITAPFFEQGIQERNDTSIKTWHYVYSELLFGFTENHNILYGMYTRYSLYHDLFLQIIASIDARIEIMGGFLPLTLTPQTDVRGILPESYYGDKKIALTGNLYIPFPLNNKFGFSLFIDSNLIGTQFSQLTPLIGGGIGIRLFTKYQNPLVIDIAYGKGIMINLSKRI